MKAIININFMNDLLMNQGSFTGARLKHCLIKLLDPPPPPSELITQIIFTKMEQSKINTHYVTRTGHRHSNMSVHVPSLHVLYN